MIHIRGVVGIFQTSAYGPFDVSRWPRATDLRVRLASWEHRYTYTIALCQNIKLPSSKLFQQVGWGHWSSRPDRSCRRQRRMRIQRRFCILKTHLTSKRRFCCYEILSDRRPIADNYVLNDSNFWVVFWMHPSPGAAIISPHGDCIAFVFARTYWSRNFR